MNALVKINSLHKTYTSNNKTTHVLKNINLEISSGEFIAVMGPSGCGKSTLLHAIAGFIEIDSGKVMLNNIPIHEQSETKRALLRRQHIGFVFQFFNLVDNLTVIENISLPLILQGEPWPLAQDKCCALLKKLKMDDKAKMLPNLLSGGEQQRVAIARSLINSPTILLADEPTGNLDSKTSREVLELLKAYNLQGQTTVMVTHNPEVACIADRIIFLQDGLVVDDTREELSPTKVLERFIGLSKHPVEER